MRPSRRGCIALPSITLLLLAAFAAVQGDSTPGNPSIHEAAGLAAARSIDSPERGRQAFTELAEALRLRPVSGYTWAALAEARYEAGVADEIFGVATIRAMELAPYEPDVQQTIAFFGLAVWDDVSSPVRAAIGRAVAHGMQSDPDALLQAAERRGRLAVACRYAPAASRMSVRSAQLCKRTEAT